MVLKKNGPIPLRLISKYLMIESDNDDLSVKKYCALIKLRRGTWYDRQDLSGEKALIVEKKKLVKKKCRIEFFPFTPKGLLLAAVE